MVSAPIYTITYTGADGAEATIETRDVEGSKQFLEEWGYKVRDVKLKKLV